MRFLQPAVCGAALIVFAASTALAAGGGSPVGLQFGEGLKDGILVHPTDKIPTAKNVAWRASTEKLAAGKLALRLVRTAGPGPHPLMIHTWTVRLKKAVRTLTGTWTAKQLRAMKLIHGTYRIDYLQRSRVVASGSWQRLNCASCGGGGSTY